MAVAINGCACSSGHRSLTAHEHRIVSKLLLCPEESCRRRALEMLAHPAGVMSDSVEIECSHQRVDADERIPGYLRDAHLPLLERRVAQIIQNPIH